MMSTARLLFRLTLLLLVAAAGCSRVPRIIVLEDPLTADEHVELGVAYERKGDLALARREYEAALRKDGKSFQARVNLGNVYLAGKEFGKAREEYLGALDLRPGDAEATNNLAWAAIFSGEGIDDAMARMEAVVSAPGGSEAALLDTLGVLRMHANRLEEGEEAFALAEKHCEETGCPEEVRREIEQHRRELRERLPAPAPTLPAIK
jgi:Tfp pilus assembly protein PilF